MKTLKEFIERSSNSLSIDKDILESNIDKEDLRVCVRAAIENVIFSDEYKNDSDSAILSKLEKVAKGDMNCDLFQSIETYFGNTYDFDGLDKKDFLNTLKSEADKYAKGWSIVNKYQK